MKMMEGEGCKKGAAWSEGEGDGERKTEMER